MTIMLVPRSIILAGLLIILGMCCSTTELPDQGHLVKRQLPLTIPLPIDYFQDQLRQILIGIPLDISFTALNYICNAIVELGIVQPKIIPDMSKMNFRLHTDECHNVSIPLTKAEELWDTPGFHKDRPTIIYITGWTSTINESNSGMMAKAYQCRNDTNFLVLDAANFVDTLYTWSALNTEAIGAYVAQALTKLDSNYVTNNLHLVGHSLGAQIAGSTGRNYKLLTGGNILPRITGLDPANPCFYDGNDLFGVRSGDAKFVDVIHSNPGIFGTPKSLGDVDFYVQGLAPFKSGCIELIVCSHSRSVQYYVETVYPTNELDFVGRRCTKFNDLRDAGKRCNASDTAIMGYAANPGTVGIFYVDANASEPFGTQANQTNIYTYTTSPCGNCTSYID